MTDVLAVVSPDGTTVRFRLASASERLAALVIDLFFSQLAALAISLVLLLVAFGGAPYLALAGLLLISFFFRNVYFAFFELLWSGQTPGKARMGLRVISRDGGPLTGQAILARNLTRELELFLPLGAVAAPVQLMPESPLLGLTLALSWLAVFALLPALNRERLRFGDLLGGTVVVRMPRQALLSDVAVVEAAGAAFTFTYDQLEVYGIEELQVLENLLRRPGDRSELVRAVASRVQRKIRWSAAGHTPPEPFLRAFYEAQRAHLERRMVFGVRKERKTG